MASGIIFDIKEFAVHDGPGIRTTVFFKGCPLSCIWCHNPEGISYKKELMIRKETGIRKIAGEIVDSRELAKDLLKNRSFLEKNKGGITISGGEPLGQPEFLFSLL